MKSGAATSADLQAPQLEETYHNNDTLLRRAYLDGKDESGEPLDLVMLPWRRELSRQDVKASILRAMSARSAGRNRIGARSPPRGLYSVTLITAGN